MLLNTLSGSEQVVVAIDISPRKWNRYMPGTRVIIRKPEAAVLKSVDLIVIVNRMYEIEIRDELKRHGIAPQLIAA